jgi:stage II sporulation protein B
VKKLDKANKPAKVIVKINGKAGGGNREVEVCDWKNAEHEAAAAADGKKEDESFDWVLPELDAEEVKEFQIINYTPEPKKKKVLKKLKSSKSVPAIFFSVAAAVVVGAVLGLIILKITQYQEGQTAKSASPAAGISLQSGAGKAAQAQLPKLSVGIIQAGVFSSKEAADAAQKDLAAKDLPAMQLSMNGSRFIFMGTAGSIELAKKMENYFSAENVEAYAKEISFASKKIQTVTSHDQNFVKQTEPFFQKLLHAAAGAMQNGELPSKDLEGMKPLFQKISALDNVKQPTLQKLKKYETAGYESLLSYQKNGNKQDLMEAQQNLLDYIKVYSGQ